MMFSKRTIRMRVKVALFLLVQAKAFSPFGPSISPAHLCSSNNDATVSFSPTVLYGLRTFLRNKLFPQQQQQQQRNNRRKKTSSFILLEEVEDIGVTVQQCNDDESESSQSTTTFSTGSSTMSVMTADNTVISGTTVSTIAPAAAITTTTTATVEISINGSSQPIENIASNNPATLLMDTITNDNNGDDTLTTLNNRPIALPPRDDAKLTRFEREYRDMLAEFLHYTKQEDIAHVKNPKLRALFEGIAASYHIPQVYRAFEILFDDYAPLRIGGRLIYAQLKQAMLEAQVERRREVESISQMTGLSKEEIEASRVAWLKMAVHHQEDKAAQLSIQQLIDLGLVETVAEVLGHDDLEAWLESFNQNFTNEEVTFCEIMIALQNCSVDSVQPECNPKTILPEIAKRLEPRQNLLDVRPLSEKKKRYIAKYDEMVHSFLEWKGNISSDQQSRKMDVLRGCFAGAESVEIVDALRIVYVDYSALRFAGDLIFKVMKSLVGSSKGNGLT
ncbi:hypothetical protein IV203_000786 [Nitzschia inconspicua]|uniref:Uncharacterized protein n=1 Tax=Nitzschia inconspicua TaxID=303405 RepID=A0A9K3L757_9STRA|nr:hypothetical protein IV203_000786 [Nitzschia inconspicua]